MKKNVCVDVDGVLASWEDGWHGVDHFGKVVPGARELLSRLRKKYNVVIYSCRTNQKLDTKVNIYGLKLRLRDWLESNNLEYDEIYCDNAKPIAAAYIDDKAIRVCEDDPESYDEACGLLGV